MLARLRAERLAAIEDKTLIIFDPRRLTDRSGCGPSQLIASRLLL
jgi:hypothetical protein